MSGIDTVPPLRKWVIIHGHFYQPPRENPWLGIIEEQPSAAPFHDWNERIYAQCYRPNAYSRLLDPDGMITGIHNNYTSMSFNFGPTLMVWLEKYHPATTRRILEGDRISRERFSGIGNALAQVYNHIIMPLASPRDQITQIRWAKESFRKSFGRYPAGLWLAETAINMETVHCLIKEKISFVILSPQQAEAFRPFNGSEGWTPAGEVPVDTRRTYRVFARNRAGRKTGGSLDIFFFDQQLSREVSFNDLLQDARTFGKRIDSCYSRDRGGDQVVVIATDGETFGHHKPFGDMCLAYFFRHVAPELGITPVNFGYYRSIAPPMFEVSLKDAAGEGTAWSCTHGVGRWIRDCGCQTGGKNGWNQAWRGPLRNALNNLQKVLDDAFTATCSRHGINPWKLRNRYGGLLGKSSRKKLLRFVSGRTTHTLSEKETVHIQRLCEAQKYMLFSFTSCGWFFADIGGIEPLQNLAYACRAIQLGIPRQKHAKVMDDFVRDLAKAAGNIDNQTGASLFESHILPFYFHEHMLSFTAAMESVLGIAKKRTFERYGYHCSLHPCTVSGKDLSGIHHITLDNETTGEQSEWLVLTEPTEFHEPRGRVLPWNDNYRTAPPSFSSVQSNDDTSLYTLSDIFSSLRSDLASVFLKNCSRRSGNRFATWLQHNERDLSLLQSIAGTIPDHFSTPLRFILQRKWDAACRNLVTPGEEKRCRESLSAIRTKARHFKCAVDLSKSAALCEELITGELEKLAHHLDSAVCLRVSRLMNIVDLFSLPVSKHRLEDILYPVLTGPLLKPYREASGRKKKDIDGEKAAVFNTLLKFARRMNFNTEALGLGK